MQAFAPNGSPILGTSEKVACRAEITDGSFERAVDGTLTYEHAGDTEVFWDEQHTETNDKGEEMFLAEDGTEWPASALVLKDDEEDAEAA